VLHCFICFSNPRLLLHKKSLSLEFLSSVLPSLLFVYSSPLHEIVVASHLFLWSLFRCLSLSSLLHLQFTVSSFPFTRPLLHFSLYLFLSVSTNTTSFYFFSSTAIHEDIKPNGRRDDKVHENNSKKYKSKNAYTETRTILSLSLSTLNRFRASDS
jgi:hypothetical protein